jgi:hypothetical protein
MYSTSFDFSGGTEKSCGVLHKSASLCMHYA